jgi:hypothetical protein
MPAKRKSRPDASVPDVEALLEQRRKEVPQVPGWQEFIDAAQEETDVTLADGRVLPRVRYGDEPDDWGADRHPCRDCRAVKGQYHVPGCEVERCPGCSGQFASCDCEYGEEPEGGESGAGDSEAAPRRYPEPKSRELTADEKARLRARIERGDGDIYALASEFGCSPSQVAGVKAAMHR